jgi:hypothetical protein
VPDKLLTADLCRMALQSPNVDDKMKKFIMERFHELKTEDEKPHQAGAKMRL